MRYLQLGLAALVLGTLSACELTSGSGPGPGFEEQRVRAVAVAGESCGAVDILEETGAEFAIELTDEACPFAGLGAVLPVGAIDAASAPVLVSLLPQSDFGACQGNGDATNIGPLVVFDLTDKNGNGVSLNNPARLTLPFDPDMAPVNTPVQVGRHDGQAFVAVGIDAVTAEAGSIQFSTATTGAFAVSIDQPQRNRGSVSLPPSAISALLHIVELPGSCAVTVDDIEGDEQIIVQNDYAATGVVVSTAVRQSDGVTVAVDTYYYDAFGKVTLVTNLDEEGDELRFEVTYERDEQDRVTFIEARFGFNPTVFTTTRRVRYGSRGQILTQIESGLEYSFTYDSDDRISRIKTEPDPDNGDDDYSVQTFDHRYGLRRATLEIFADAQDDEFDTLEITRNCDWDTVRVDHDYNTNGTIDFAEFSAYDPGGRLVFNGTDTNGDADFEQASEFEYDQSGRLTSADFYGGGDGRLVQVETHSYTGCEIPELLTTGMRD